MDEGVPDLYEQTRSELKKSILGLSVAISVLCLIASIVLFVTIDGKYSENVVLTGLASVLAAGAAAMLAFGVDKWFNPPTNEEIDAEADRRIAAENNQQ
jgi:hypothetical protein